MATAWKAAVFAPHACAPAMQFESAMGCLSRLAPITACECKAAPSLRSWTPRACYDERVNAHGCPSSGLILMSECPWMLAAEWDERFHDDMQKPSVLKHSCYYGKKKKK
eukprot:scaffold204115_cov21-Tisochrysis_lutea.AAC.4